MKQLAWATALLIVCGPSIALAADAPPPPKLEPIAEVPPPADASAPVIEEGSEVLTREEGGVRIEEYRRKGGQLYLVKVTPKVGAPYFLTNPTESGAMPSGDGRDKTQRTPSWIIKSW